MRGSDEVSPSSPRRRGSSVVALETPSLGHFSPCADCRARLRAGRARSRDRGGCGRCTCCAGRAALGAGRGRLGACPREQRRRRLLAPRRRSGGRDGIRVARARSCHRRHRRLRRALGVRGRLRRGTEGAVVRHRRRGRAPRAHRRVRASDREAGTLRRRHGGGDDRRGHRRPAAALRVLPGGQGARRRAVRRRRPVRARPRGAAPAHPGHLEPGLLRQRHALRRRHQLRGAGDDRGRRLDADRPRAGARRAARRAALCRDHAAAVGTADHHAAVRAGARAGRAVRSHRRGDGLAVGVVRHSAIALALRPAGRLDRPAPHVLADRLHDPARCAAGDQPRARGGRADAARVALAGVPHDHVAAAQARARQRVPAGLRREPGRLRQPDRARRQLRSAVDQDLLRRRRRAARSRTGGGARDGAVGAHARRLLDAAALARALVVRDGERQGRRRRARQPAAAAVDRLLHVRRALDRVHALLLRGHPDRRLRQGHRPRRPLAPPRALRLRDSASSGGTAVRRSPARRGTACSRPCSWRRSRRR